MVPEKKLYRSRDSLLGGVCKGIAEYFNIDPIVVQIITVVLTIATAGMAGIAYIALWIIMPLMPDPNAPVDVHAHEVHSDTYGQVDYGMGRQTEATAASGTSSAGDSYVGCAHTPPEPPFTSSSTSPPPASAHTEAHEVAQAYATASPVERGGSPEAAPKGEPGYASQSQTSYQGTQQGSTASQAAYQGASQNPMPPQGVARADSTRVSGGALWFGFILLFIGITALLSFFVEGVQWWQFWPLIFVISGIGHMVVPDKKGRRMDRFVNGLTSFSFGVAALPFSLGLIALSSLIPIFTNLWPLLVIMCGLFVLGGAMKAPIITLLGGLCFVAFCVIAIGWFAVPGPTDIISMTLPNGRTYSYDFNMWAW